MLLLPLFSFVLLLELPPVGAVHRYSPAARIRASSSSSRYASRRNPRSAIRCRHSSAASSLRAPSVAARSRSLGPWSRMQREIVSCGLYMALPPRLPAVFNDHFHQRLG